MAAAADDALVEQSGSDDQELEALEDNTDHVDNVNAAAQAVKSCTFLKCNLSCEWITLTLAVFVAADGYR